MTNSFCLEISVLCIHSMPPPPPCARHSHRSLVETDITPPQHLSLSVQRLPLPVTCSMSLRVAKLLLLLLLLVVAGDAVWAQSELLVQTQSGILTGKYTSSAQKSIQFLGVPFAQVFFRHSVLLLLLFLLLLSHRESVIACMYATLSCPRNLETRAWMSPQ